MTFYLDLLEIAKCVYIPSQIDYLLYIYILNLTLRIHCAFHLVHMSKLMSMSVVPVH
jgi:hypothetical protein